MSRTELEAIQILERIFGTREKVKILRMFLFNKDQIFDLDDVVLMTKVKKPVARKELANLEKAELLVPKVFNKEIIRKRAGKKYTAKKKSSGWAVNTKFPYLIPLQNLLVHINPLKHRDIVKKITQVGRIKLLIISGIFIQEHDSRVDLLVVGDALNDSKLLGVVRAIESEIGKELRFATFSTTDFEYRHGMCDKLVRDILDFPHERVIDRLDLH